MPPQIDEPDDTELNPLLNPLLNQNMDRWAQVYFTSPTNKRDQAVRDLVRELRSREIRQPVSTRSMDSASTQSYYWTGPNTAPRADAPTPLRNTRNQRFFAARQQARPDRKLHDRRRYAPASGRGHPYLALFAAIAALLVACIAWYSPQVQTARSLPAPALPRTSSAPEQAREPASDASDRDSPQRDPAAEATDQLADAGADNDLDAASADTRQRATKPLFTEPAAPGAAELSTAKRYLTGSDRRSHDTAQAVPWLWRAVSKHNLEAMELLSDLYLKGKGVPKSCEQGRILLDAAAMRGDQQAAGLLRHLQAFGCE